MSTSAIAGAAGARATTEQLPPGTTVGEYELAGVLGQGGFGTVYRANHPLIGKEAAVKVLSHRYAASPEMMSRFVEEARAVNTIGHANIVDIFSFGKLDDGRPYFVMELLDGAPLDLVLGQQGPLAPGMVIDLMRGVAKALDAAHLHDIIHRDLKPGNIFLTFDGDGQPTSKLVDFGIAKLEGDNQQLQHKTRSGIPIGTPDYMAPEQCLGLDVDQRVDVYAFGVVCFQALSGKRPFEGNNYLELLTKQTTAERPLISSICPALGASYDDALRTIMAIDRQERPATVMGAWRLLEKAAVTAGHIDAASGDGATPSMPAGTRRELKVVLERARTLHALSGLQGRPSAVVEDGDDEPTVASAWLRRGVIIGALSLAAAGTYSAGQGLEMVAPADSDSELAASTAATSAQPSAEPPASAPVAPATATLTASAAAPAPSAPPTATASASTSATAEPAVLIECNAPGAVAYLKKKRLGKLPGSYTLGVPEGNTVKITVIAPGYQTQEVDIEVRAGAEKKIALKRAAPQVSIDLEDPGI